MFPRKRQTYRETIGRFLLIAKQNSWNKIISLVFRANNSEKNAATIESVTRNNGAQQQQQQQQPQRGSLNGVNNGGVNSSNNTGVVITNPINNTNTNTMSKLYVGNLPSDCNEAALRQLFQGHNLSCTTILVKRGGYAFVDCSDQSTADRAIDKLNGKYQYTFLPHFYICHPYSLQFHSNYPNYMQTFRFIMIFRSMFYCQLNMAWAKRHEQIHRFHVFIHSISLAR